MLFPFFVLVYFESPMSRKAKQQSILIFCCFDIMLKNNPVHTLSSWNASEWYRFKLGTTLVFSTAANNIPTNLPVDPVFISLKTQVFIFLVHSILQSHKGNQENLDKSFLKVRHLVLIILQAQKRRRREKTTFYAQES